MGSKKYRRQFISIILLIVCIVFTIFLFIKLENLNNSGEIVFSDSINEDTSSKEERASLKVDIRGAVNSPGVYEFIEGETFENALIKAGGLSENADLSYVDFNLNRASKLSDEQKIYIPAKGEISEPYEGSVENSGNSISDKVDINTSTKEELMSLPGIGEAYADRIIESRPYKNIEEIKNVKGIGDSIYGKIKDKIKV